MSDGAIRAIMEFAAAGGTIHRGKDGRVKINGPQEVVDAHMPRLSAHKAKIIEFVLGDPKIVPKPEPEVLAPRREKRGRKAAKPPLGQLSLCLEPPGAPLIPSAPKPARASNRKAKSRGASQAA